MYTRNLKIDFASIVLTLFSLLLLAVCLLNVAWNYVSIEVQAALSSLSTAIFIVAALLKSRQDDRELEYWRKQRDTVLSRSVLHKRAI